MKAIKPKKNTPFKQYVGINKNEIASQKVEKLDDVENETKLFLIASIQSILPGLKSSNHGIRVLSERMIWNLVTQIENLLLLKVSKAAWELILERNNFVVANGTWKRTISLEELRRKTNEKGTLKGCLHFEKDDIIFPVFEHSVPISFMCIQLFKCDGSAEKIWEILCQYHIAVITSEEDKRLSKTFRKNWREEYAATGITLLD